VLLYFRELEIPSKLEKFQINSLMEYVEEVIPLGDLGGLTSSNKLKNI
jgi:hypothetical protein